MLLDASKDNNEEQIYASCVKPGGLAGDAKDKSSWRALKGSGDNRALALQFVRILLLEAGPSIRFRKVNINAL
jgi:hypothetical protein